MREIDTEIQKKIDRKIDKKKDGYEKNRLEERQIE